MKPISIAWILVLAAAIPLGAQESEKAEVSKLTKVGLPEGAQRILAEAARGQAEEILKSLYPDSRFEKIETIFWEGDYSGKKGRALRRKVEKAVEEAGHGYEEAKSERQIDGRDVYLCAVTLGERRVVGMWVASDEAAMLVWGREKAGAGAAERVFGNVVYVAPPGWAVETAADAVTLTPRDLLAEERLSVLVLTGREFKEDLGASAETLFNETCLEFGVESEGIAPGGRDEARTSARGWEYVRVRAMVRKDKARLYLEAWLIKVGGRLERVVGLTNLTSWPSDQSPLTSPKYENAFLRFVHTLRFRNHKEPALAAGSLQGEGLAGVWVGMGLGLNGLRGELEYKSFTAAFYTNGQVFFASKLQSFLFEGMDPSVAREITPSYWGTYTFEKGRGTMRMPQGDLPIEVDGEKLIITRLKTPHTYVRLDPVDGARWDGTYAFEPVEGKAAEITFTKDGRFSDNGAVKVLEHSLYSLYSTGKEPGEGTYEVKNFTLVLRYKDGRTFTTAYLGLLAAKGDPSPATLTLGFNHDTLKRK